MHTLKERLRYLRSREALATVVLPTIISWKWWAKGSDVAWSMRIAALSLLVWILMQGTLYWHLKLRSIERQVALPPYFSQMFRGFKWSNLIAMCCIAVALFLEHDFLSQADMRWSIGLLVGAILEQINYYHYQLMYDTRASIHHLRRHRRLRKAALGIDIVRSDGRPTHCAAA